MAESSGEKTEMPTQKKLRDARQKGQVCSSKDIVSTAILIVLFALLGWMGLALVDDISEMLGISQSAIKQHLAHICEKLGAANRSEAAAIAIRRQIVKV